MNVSDLPTKYDAPSVEPGWYARWEEAGLFSPSGKGEPYTITIPPPNITGSLHMGHALCYPIQDFAGRFQRLLGKSVLILPGQDHAGIATQSVVIKKLKAEGINPVELGRAGFEEETWKWRKQSGDTILKQFRSLGCAFDWQRSRFTLDDDYAAAVIRVFIDWYDRGLIYRGKRVVNWDPTLKTSVSDIETEREEINGNLYHVRYPYADGSGHIVVATTRPETMLGDVAVAVHPSDERYKAKIGQKLLLPLLDKPIPLIADTYPDPEFGTGAVKITPAHDPNDYQVGVRHDLPMPVILDESGVVNELGGPYQGLDRKEARKRIVADLKEAGLLEKIEPHRIAILKSDRSKDIIEPLLSEQWFVRMEDLAKPAIDAAKDGRLRFTPSRYTDVYLDWLENIRDWNIGRKLWWGHRIPVYYTEDGQHFAATSWEEAQTKAGDAKIVRQDDEVLDTWFSSGLWPFATLGWPETTEDLTAHYPTQHLITDRNIIYLWVTRMVMMGIDFTGKLPFDEVFVYATVLTEDGQRMSKSLGTGVDPMGIIESKGADAMRWTLLSQAGENQELRYSERRTDDARNFANKIWNASRFVLMNLEGYDGSRPEHLEPVDTWLLAKLAQLEPEIRSAYESWNLQAACQRLHQFFWSEYCDWYIEIAKPRLADPALRAAPQYVLATALEAFLKMLHPIMPFVTEEVFQHLPHREDSDFVMSATWPTFEEPAATEVVETVEQWLDLVRALRALRAELGLSPIKKIPKAYVSSDLGAGHAILQSQAWIESLETGMDTTVKCVGTTLNGIDLAIPIEGLIDVEKEVVRLDREHTKLEAEILKLRKRLDNPAFVERAKPEVVEKQRAQLAELEDRLAKNRERRNLLS